MLEFMRIYVHLQLFIAILYICLHMFFFYFCCQFHSTNANTVTYYWL